MLYQLENAYALKSLIEQLFGSDAWYEVKHCEDLRVWKKYSKRILSAISASVVSTVSVADDAWFTEMENEISRGKLLIEESNSLDLVFANLSAALECISFLQIGMKPIRTTKNVAARPGQNWNLSQFRSVQYVQDSDQKKASEKDFVEKSQL